MLLMHRAALVTLVALEAGCGGRGGQPEPRPSQAGTTLMWAKAFPDVLPYPGATAAGDRILVPGTVTISTDSCPAGFLTWLSAEGELADRHCFGTDRYTAAAPSGDGS